MSQNVYFLGYLRLARAHVRPLTQSVSHCLAPSLLHRLLLVPSRSAAWLPRYRPEIGCRLAVFYPFFAHFRAFLTPFRSRFWGSRGVCACHWWTPRRTGPKMEYNNWRRWGLARAKFRRAGARRCRHLNKNVWLQTYGLTDGDSIFYIVWLEGPALRNAQNISI